LILLPMSTAGIKAGRGPFHSLPISLSVWDPDADASANGKTPLRPGGSVLAPGGETLSAASAGPVPSRRDAGPHDFRSINPILLFLNGFGMIWIGGFLILLGRLFYGISSLAKFKRGLVRIPEEELAGVVEDVRTVFSNTKLPTIFLSPAINSPLALGILRPAVVLPRSLYQSLSEEELRSILIHEIAHIRHLDQACGILQRIMTSFYWWNPLVYKLNASISLSMEEVSDNYVIRKNGAHAYARCLVALAEKTSLVSRLPATAGMATPHMSLETRVKNIVSKERVMATQLKKSLVMLLAFSAIGLIAIAGRFSITLEAAQSASNSFALPSGMEPVALAVDRDRIYILERENSNLHIAVFSATDFSLLAKIGRAGSGPGEFLLGPVRFHLADGQIWAMDIKKFVVFSKDAVFQKEIPIPRGMGITLYPLIPLGENSVTLGRNFPDLSNWKYEVFARIYDREFRLIKEFGEGLPLSAPPPPPPPPPPPGRKTEPKESEAPAVKIDYQAIPDCVDIAVAENKIFVADTRKGFHISVYDSKGASLYEIDLDYASLPVPPEYSSALMKKLQETQGWLNQVANIKVRDSFPAFFGFKVADNKIYVSTYAEQNGLHELVVMNLRGDVLKRAFSFPLGPNYESLYNNFGIARDRYAILDDKIYYFAKNPTNGSLELRIQDLK